MDIRRSFFLTGALYTALSSVNAMAFEFEGRDILMAPKDAEAIPSGCAWGRAESGGEGGTISWDEAKSAYNAAVDLADYRSQTLEENGQDAKSIWDFANAIYSIVDSRDYLRTEGPGYVIQGQWTRFKGNTLKPLVNVRFYTNEGGFVGSDKSNEEANSYRYLRFDREYGAGIVWTESDGMCSAMGVLVHNAPEISASGEMDSNFATIRYYVDNRYSRAVRENEDVTITISQDGLSGTRKVPAIGLNKVESSSSAEVTIEKGSNNKYYGVVKVFYPGTGFDENKPVTVSVNDGTYTKSRSFRISKPQADSNDSGGVISSGNCTSLTCEAESRTCSGQGGEFQGGSGSYVCYRR